MNLLSHVHTLPKIHAGQGRRRTSQMHGATCHATAWLFPSMHVHPAGLKHPFLCFV